MNGFAHTILSLMLSWIRALISNLWSLLNSEDGGRLYQFLAKNWLHIVLALCLAGVLVDLIIYFFRWRPYYVWRSKLRRLRHPREEDEPVYEEPAVPVPPPQGRPVYAAAEPSVHYAPLRQSAEVYQPAKQQSASEPLLDDPVFDEEGTVWDEAAAPLETEWLPQRPSDFGAPKPEPAAYYHHIEAGYAPPVPPEQLYTPSSSYQSPVHPGLDEDAFRQSFGLQTDEEAIQERIVVHAPAFRPFTVVDEEEPPQKANPFARFARRARELVGVEDEDHRPTIHDLQSTVDVSQAFHAPVYPQPLDHHREG